jgi:hypothetical protein
MSTAALRRDDQAHLPSESRTVEDDRRHRADQQSADEHRRRLLRRSLVPNRSPGPGSSAAMILALNRLNVRYTMAVRCSSKGINDAIALIPDDAWTSIE